ncbi:hypothetical protein FPQ18DRAFT_403513 [Pyronema domesticum]|nr:hypothetical protein FPQ18DRAFT_403513 [Pyronema domesticum]
MHTIQLLAPFSFLFAAFSIASPITEESYFKPAPVALPMAHDTNVNTQSCYRAECGEDCGKWNDNGMIFCIDKWGRPNGASLCCNYSGWFCSGMGYGSLAAGGRKCIG